MALMNKMKSIWVFFLLTIVANINTYAQASDSKKEYLLKSSIFESRLYIYVTLNHKLSGYMLFDNGATRCVIFRQYLKKANISIAGTEGKVNLFDHQQDIPVTNKIDIQLSQLISSIPSAYIVEEQNYEECNNIIGTIGSNLINKYNWSIDIRNNKVFCKKEPYIDEKAIFQKYPKKENGNIYLTGKIGVDKVSFFIDFGYDGELLIPKQYANKIGFLKRDFLGYTYKGNIGGVVPNSIPKDFTVAKIDNIQLGNFRVHEVNATIGDFLFFNIGTTILKYFKIYINSTKNEIAFLPFEAKKIVLPRVLDYGLDFNYDGRVNAFIVTRIFDYYGENRSFSIGQIVRSINNRFPGDFNNKCVINSFILDCRTLKSFDIITNNNRTYSLIRSEIPFRKLHGLL